MFRNIRYCIFAPRLYKIYNVSEELSYNPNFFEKWAGMAIIWIKGFWTMFLYTLPLHILMLLSSNWETCEHVTVCLIILISIYIICIIIRAYGRALNKNYMKFVKDVYLSSSLENVQNYDFDFKFWPVSFTAKGQKCKRTLYHILKHFPATAHPHFSFIPQYIVRILAYCVVHTFGLIAIYPGSIKILQVILWDALVHGRQRLMQEYHGRRAKIVTSDMNALDTMFVDHRNNRPHGKTLVVCCERSTGYYELGIMLMPLKAGYSVLGWNHPGFAESTGSPYPDQERCAIDAVMQYAIEELKFDPSDIVVFGSNIGGYTATWAAVNYPKVKGLFLDAVFDDLFPLAKKSVPVFLEFLVREVVRCYVNLNLNEIILKYPGATHIIRRSYDEKNCLQEGQISTNCCNELALKIIRDRQPHMDQPENIALLRKYISMPECTRHFDGRANENNIKKLLAIISTYITDIDTTHYAQLPEGKFHTILNQALQRQAK